MPLYPIDPRREAQLAAELEEERAAHADTREELRIMKARLKAAVEEHGERVRERDEAITAHRADLMRFARLMLEFEARGDRQAEEIGKVWRLYREYRAGCRCNNKVL